MFSRILLCASFLSLHPAVVPCAGASSIPPATSSAKTDSLKGRARLEAFPAGDVLITGGVFLKNQELDKAVLLSLDDDRLLYPFLKNAGLKISAGVKPYGGWEQTDLRGHTLGHYLTALSYLYAQTRDPELKERIDHIVLVLDQCQQEFETGYLSAFPEKMLDVVEQTGQGWAPYYTLHKILQGLIDAYQLANNQEALAVASYMGDYFYERTTRITDPAAWERSLDEMEQGGFAEAMLHLYFITRQPIHLQCARFFQQKSKLAPLAENRDVLNDPAKPHNYRHVNATIPQFIAAERLYEQTGDKFYAEAAFNFWDKIVPHRMYSNGSTGYFEHWNCGPDSLSKELGMKAGETCCSYNMVRLSNDLCRLSPDSRYADYVERVLLNHIVGSIHPETGDFMYFHTQQPGSFKTFGRNREVFWCCTGTGMENHVRYAESVYFKGKNELYVNQFLPSRLAWREKGIRMEQRTAFPEEGRSTLVVTGGEAKFTLAVRVPYWCKGGMRVLLNGQEKKVRPDRKGYYKIKRTWKAGDEVELILPMQLHAERLADWAQRVSILSGPLVLAGDLGTKGVTSKLILTTDNFYGTIPAPYQVKMPIPALTGSAADFSWLVPVEGKPLEFSTRATSDGSTLYFRPLYSTYKNRFSTYWQWTPAD